MKYAAMAIALLMLSGCALTQEEIQQLSDVVAQKAGERAYTLTYEKSIKAGLSEEKAKEIATAVRDGAGEVAAKLMTEVAGRAAEKKGSKTGQGILGAIWAIAQLALGAGIGAPKLGGGVA